MKLSNIIPTADQLKLVQGIEGNLLRRRRSGTISATIALAGAIFQIVLSFSEKDYLESVGNFFINLVQLRFGELLGPKGLSVHELTGILVLVIGFSTYFLFRWTSFLLKESEEPFRYTFSIDSFTQVEKTPDKRFTLNAADRFLLLHHDLMESLDRRIRRFSLLDTGKEGVDKGTLTSHIHIRGHYAIREEKAGKWVIHVMPRVRVGPSNSPETLAYPVKYALLEEKVKRKEKEGKEEKSEDTNSEAANADLDADKYNQIV